MALSARDAVARLNDTRSVAHGVAWTAVNAAILLIDPRRLGGRGRLLYRLANGVLAAWTAWAAMRTDLRAEVPAVASAGYAAGAAGVLMAAAEMTESVDARLHDGLARRGVRRPRVLMAAGGAALAAVA
ncbi:hypothetical protein [Microbacterium marinilacus]|uniref:Uncharacterized protein n=1 Tax=Microbacterium marinilacus TaxID=415209 RepID=A0ABP7B802_9MICO|nr:hypothetical protein [Microbacterium marinilacus]MBY0687304.1 hypothetical protein [Microbacterium marinilacus]